MILNWPEVIRREGREAFCAGGWVKFLQDLDPDRPGGYAYLGTFITKAKAGLTDCPDGLYLVCSKGGSPENPIKNAAIFRIQGEEVWRETDWVEGDDWSLKLRPKALELLGKKINPLENIPTEDLVNELKARGVPLARGIKDRMALAEHQVVSREKTF